MQEKASLDKLVAQLSDDDRTIFEQLAAKLKDVKGDIGRLSSSDLKTIQQMEEKYADKLSEVDLPQEQTNDTGKLPVVELLATPFAAKVRELLAVELKERFSKEEEAVAFTFNNKWIPLDLKDPQKAASLFEEYKQDISEANQWREELVGIDSDKVMAVGLTWFMVIFQLNRQLNS